jgi:hypothetical protein
MRLRFFDRLRNCLTMLTSKLNQLIPTMKRLSKLSGAVVLAATLAAAQALPIIT